MNTNKIFRIFAKDLHKDKEKKFVGVVETIPPNNVITLTVPTLKEAYVFSAHDPMKVSEHDGEALCVQFSATLTDGTGPGELQEFLFYFSTDIKVTAFLKEASMLMENAKKSVKSTTDAAVIRRSSLINSDGKLKTGNLMQRVATRGSVMNVVRKLSAVKESKEEKDKDKPEPAKSPEPEQTNEQAKPDEMETTEEEEEASSDTEETETETSETTKTTAPPEPVNETRQGRTLSIDQMAIQASRSSAAVASTNEEKEEESESPEKSIDPFLAAANIMMGANASSSEEVEDDQDESEDEELSSQEEEEEAPQRHRSSVDNTDVTQPNFYNITRQEEAPSPSSALVRTASLDNTDATQPQFYEPSGGPGDAEDDTSEEDDKTAAVREEDSDTPVNSEEESNFEQFLFQGSGSAVMNTEDRGQVVEESQQSDHSIDLPEEYTMEESDSSEDEIAAPPPIRLNSSNRRQSALRHSFAMPSSQTSSMDTSQGRRRQTDSMITHSGAMMKVEESESVEDDADASEKAVPLGGVKDPESIALLSFLAGAKKERKNSESMITHSGASFVEPSRPRRQTDSMITHPESVPEPTSRIRRQTDSMITHSGAAMMKVEESVEDYADETNEEAAPLEGVKNPESIALLSFLAGAKKGRKNSESMITHSGASFAQTGGKIQRQSIVENPSEVNALEELDLPPPLPPSPSPSKSPTKTQARVERLRSSVIEGLTRAATQKKIESSYVSGVENLLKMQQDRIKELEENERVPSSSNANTKSQDQERERMLHQETERLLHQRELEHQEQIDNLVKQQSKKEISLQESLAGEMHDMRRDYERRIENLERQLRSDENERLHQIREEYDHMRDALKNDFEHRINAREQQVRKSEEDKHQRLRDEFESKVEDQLSLKLEYENKMAKLIDQHKVEAEDRTNQIQTEYERRIHQLEAMKEKDATQFDLLRSGYEEKLKKSETKYHNLSNTFKALKNHELKLHNKASETKEKAEVQKLHTLLSLTWNMMSTLDSEIAHFESLQLPAFDWDKHAGGINPQYKLAELSALPSYGNGSTIDNPPPLASTKVSE